MNSHPDDLTVFFALLGSALVKALRKHVVEIDPLSPRSGVSKDQRCNLSYVSLLCGLAGFLSSTMKAVL